MSCPNCCTLSDYEHFNQVGIFTVSLFTSSLLSRFYVVSWESRSMSDSIFVLFSCLQFFFCCFNAHIIHLLWFNGFIFDRLLLLLPGNTLTTFLRGLDNVRVTAWRIQLLSIWRLVLAYWFPASQGYSLTGDFDLQGSNIDVLFQGQPFLLLWIHGVTDINSNVARRTLKERANKIFDRGVLWSGHPVLCVISAIGMRWNGFIRSTETYRTSEQAQRVLSDDWLGGWSEDVSSQASHDVLSHFFGLLKSSCTSVDLIAFSLLNYWTVKYIE